MSTADLSLTVGILKSLYQHVQTLEEFADSIVFKEGPKATLIEQSDTNRFKSFVRDVFVCFDKELQQVPSRNQICTLPELLAFVLNRLKRKKKRNVLAHGYNFLSLAQEKRDADHFKFQGDVTQSAAYIHGSDLWKKVTMRLGTDITRTNNSAQFGRYRGALTLKRRREVEKPATSKKSSRTDVRVEKGKRKRETEGKDEEEIMTCPGKRRRVGQRGPMQEIQQVCYETIKEGQPIGHLSKGQMEELTPAQVASLPKATVTSRLRFIPKTDGMRPITRVIGADAKTRQYLGHVRDLLDILRACVRSTPSLLGSTVWGMTDIHKVLRSIAPAQKETPQPLYFVKVDVSGAYESLPHDKLIEVIGHALSPVQDELFTIRRYAKIWVDSHEGLKKSFVRQADFLEDNMGSTNMKGFVMALQRSGKVHHTILVEQHFCSDLCGREALQFFTQMLTGSVVQFGKKTYRQCRGIPQGSVVSSLLCCLCYGHMENVLFKDVTKKKGCLMRLVDDFLLITPDFHEAQTFLKILLAGVPQYGLVVNPQKVVVNFQALGSEGSCPGIRMLPPHCLFPWCGLLLDTHLLDVYKDYSSYAGLSLRYSLSLGSFHSAGQQMRRKLMGILRLKCHALFLDLKTNSLEAVYKNFYKLVLLHARRFHVCAQSLPFGQTVGKNPVYFLQMIWDMAEYGNQLIRLSNKGNISPSYIRVNKAQTGIVQYEAVELLFCLSFLLVLSQHRPLYKDLLPHLQKRKRSLERRLGDLRLARVRQATNPRTPVDFLAIKT
ncbi:Telomerase reverse transcriptase [Nibea albiflora]|uniref:Telomerase reverse transcriptase n=1 Tax=Nibea albiflora TaxID=240163 RepID=A0ACB7EWB4_NIBAL|nr:Telomerase reverse transcriptase [Nibea albiflora]